MRGVTDCNRLSQRSGPFDETVLPKLTEDHLRELGFPLGARLKLLDSIATLGPTVLGSATQVKAPPPPIPPASPTTSAAPETAGERRHVTVMFSDLVGSTALSARMDPELSRALSDEQSLWPSRWDHDPGGLQARSAGLGAYRSPLGARWTSEPPRYTSAGSSKVLPARIRPLATNYVPSDGSSGSRPTSHGSCSSERGAPFTTAGFARMVERAGKVAKLAFKPHPVRYRSSGSL
jgi:hypothetical protein